MALAESLNSPMTDPIGALGGVLREPSLQKRGAKARELTEPLMRAESQARTDFEKATAEAKKAQITKEKGLQDEFVTGLETAQTAYEGELGQQPERTITAFNPERATELAVLTAIMGAFAGSVSGRAGLAAMKGVSEGYRTGQEDLYKREVANYEAALGQYKQKIAEAKQIYDNAVKLETAKQGAGLIELKKLDPLLQDSVITAKTRVQDFVGAGESLRNAMKLADQLEQKKVEAGFPRASSQQMRLTTIQGQDGKSYIVDALQFVPGTNPALGVRGVIGESPKGAGGRAGQYALTYASRVYGNIQNAFQDLENIQNLPAVAQSPVLSGMINRDPETAFSSITALIGRKITNKEARAFDQVANSLSAALARLESQGLASGGTKANIAAFDAVKPRAGDDAINMALYIARVKQEIEVGINVHDKMPGATTEQKAEAQRILRELDRVVPFDTTDVMNTLRQNQAQMSEKMNKLVNTPTIAEQIKPEFIESGGKRFQLNPETGNYKEIPSGRP